MSKCKDYNNPTPRPNFIENMTCEDYMKLFDNNSIDMIITSPPYNMGNNELGHNDKSGKYEEFTDDMTDEEYSNTLNYSLELMLRITKKHIFYNIQYLPTTSKAICDLMYNYKSKLKEIIMWNKPGAPNIQEGILTSNFEFVFVFSNQAPDTRKFYDANFSQGTLGNVFKTESAGQNKYAKLNSATFPVSLPRWFLRNFGSNDGNILDPYTGTGTTQAAAIQLGYKEVYGCDLSKKSCEVANRRIENEFNNRKNNGVQATLDL